MWPTAQRTDRSVMTTRTNGYRARGESKMVTKGNRARGESKIVTNGNKARRESKMPEDRGCNGDFLQQKHQIASLTFQFATNTVISIALDLMACGQLAL